MSHQFSFAYNRQIVSNKLNLVKQVRAEQYRAALISKSAQQIPHPANACWEGFTGRVIPREPASPEGVPAEYVMKPYDVKLSYMGKSWCTVPLEVSHNEIGDADVIDWIELTDVAALFEKVGLPPPSNAPIMPISHQVAQKLHALTSGGDRVRDLIDLQLIVRNCEMNLFEIRKKCIRLFAYRKAQSRPPLVENRDGWEALYLKQSSGLPVLPSVAEAIEWLNAFIGKINAVTQDASA